MTTEIAIFIIGQFFVLAGACIGIYVNTSNRLVKLETRFETTFNLLGENAARFLHRDDDIHGMDGLLDKYLDRHYEMNFKEWEELLVKCEIAKNDLNVPLFHRYLAGQLAAVCHHKLKHDPTEEMRSRSIKL